MKLIECVPNFSEGKDLAKVKAITDAIESVDGITLLDVDPVAPIRGWVPLCLDISITSAAILIPK